MARVCLLSPALASLLLSARLSFTAPGHLLFLLLPPENNRLPPFQELPAAAAAPQASLSDDPSVSVLFWGGGYFSLTSPCQYALLPAICVQSMLPSAALASVRTNNDVILDQSASLGKPAFHLHHRVCVCVSSECVCVCLEKDSCVFMPYGKMSLNRRCNSLCLLLSLIGDTVRACARVCVGGCVRWRRKSRRWLVYAYTRVCVCVCVTE